VLRELREEAVAFVERVARTLNGDGPVAAATAPPPPPAVEPEPEPPPKEPPPPPPPPPRKPAAQPASGTPHPKSRAAAEQRAEEMGELLKRQSPATEAELSKATGWSSRSVRTALFRLRDDGKAHETGQARHGPHGGRASTEWAFGEGGSSPEPGASVPTMDGAEATEDRSNERSESQESDHSGDPETETLAEGVMRTLAASWSVALRRKEIAERMGVEPHALTDPLAWLRAAGRVEKCGGGNGTTYRIPDAASPAGETEVVEGDDKEPHDDIWTNLPEPDEPTGRKLTSQERGGRVQAGIVAGNEGLARRIEEACTLERRTVAEIAELLGEDKRLVGQMVKAMERVGRIESRGGKSVGSQLMACYQRRLRPEEDPSITIRQADRTGSVESRVVAVLEQDERLTVEQLAAALVLHPRIVAQAVSTLRGEGRVEKLPGGAYQLAEDTRAVT
jgi:Mn-dependent DtxR family transcriptional regulator